jgi:hypothetical protein
MWLNKLKVAVVTKNFLLVSKLLENIPLSATKKELEEAYVLLQEATNSVVILRDETAQKMKKMKSNIDFLNSAQAQQSAKFDIRS